MRRILLVAPLASELKRLKSQLGNWQFEKTNISSQLSLERVVGQDIYLACCGLGKPQSALQTQHALDAIGNVQTIFLVGAAGAIEKSLSAGDLVIGLCTVEHDHKEKFNPRPLPSFAGAENWLEKISSTSIPHHLAPIASGDEDIVDLDRAQELHQETGAHAVAWEGAGVARAAKFNKIEFVEIRGITDSANEKAPEDFDKNLTLAMGRIAELLLQIF